MSLPTVTIVGRPNVGKSSLLNALAGEMISIVEPTAGVTRDRVSTMIEHQDAFFELVDTGGYGIVDSDELKDHIEDQIQKAIDTATLVVFMVDVRDGLMPLDKKIAQLLRKNDLKVIGVANKADTPKLFPSAGEFGRLGFGDFLCISATNNLNKSLLLDQIVEELEGTEITKPADATLKITLVGKRNAGKSTLVNAMVGEDRVIVSEVAGTTRDAVDVRFKKDNKEIVVIDTAGLRKKSKIKDNIEFYSSVRAVKSIRRADVVLMVIDASEPVSQVDKKLAQLISDEYATCVVVVNKWDLAKDVAATDDYGEYLTKVLPGLNYTPIAFTTAKEKKNIQSLLDLAAEMHKQATLKIPTSKLNKAIEMIRAEQLAGKGKSRWPKIFYATQVATKPITLLLFVSRPDLFEENYKRFLVNKLRTILPISDVPIRLLARAKRKGE